MRKKLTSVADSFVTRLESLEQTRNRVEQLHREQLMGKREVERVYGSLFITAVAFFEALLEELFLGLLVGKFETPCSIQPRMAFYSEVAARLVLFADNPYLEWLPYSKTTKRANIFFSGGRPFSILDDGDRSTISRMGCLRNALAHRSKFAMRKFNEEVIGDMALRPREKTPTAYLRTAVRVDPIQTRYEQLTLEMSSISFKLSGRRIK